MPTKAEQELSPAKVRELCEKLFRTPGGRTLRVIREEVKKAGVDLNPTSGATAFRDGPFKQYLDELKAASELAENVSAVAKQGIGMSDGAASAFAAKVFDAARHTTVEDIGTEKGNMVSLAISRLRAGDRNAKKLEADLKLRDEQVAGLQRERTEWEEQRAKIEAVTEKVRTATPATIDEVRAAAVVEIDGIMGIKTKK